MSKPSQRPRLIDPVLALPRHREKPAPLPARPALPPRPYATPPVTTAAKADAKPKRKKRRRVWMPAMIIGVLFGAILAGLALYSVELGEILVGLYAVICLWRQLPSRQAFSAALATLGGIVLAQIAAPDGDVANNLAVYTFLLLVLGVILLAREVWQDNRYA